MARGLNKVMLIGNLGQDPELRYTQNGTAVTTISVATNERMKKNGEWVDYAEWHRVVIWGKLAEFVAQYLRKGNQVYVEGRNQTRQWEDQEGVTHRVTEVIAHTISPLGSYGDTAQQEEEAPPAEEEAPSASRRAAARGSNGNGRATARRSAGNGNGRGAAPRGRPARPAPAANPFEEDPFEGEDVPF